MIRAAQIAERVSARLQRDGSYMGHCPGRLHSRGDRRSSLAIREGDRGTLLHCFSGCSAQNVCDALGIKVSDLFYDQLQQPRRYQSPDELAAQRQIADLRSRLTPRERVQAIVIIKTDPESIDLAIARALALAVVDQEFVQIIFTERPR